ncbi:hypothetical protein CN981_08620 [Priestia megaterium]|nr:hypothetical protein CN981_08620 [Priestia megaterium]
MFMITYENEVYRQWSDDYIFEDFDKAKAYLKGKGFIEDNRTFKRENYNWVTYQKAYIEPVKLYKG